MTCGSDQLIHQQLPTAREERPEIGVRRSEHVLGIGSERQVEIGAGVESRCLPPLVFHDHILERIDSEDERLRAADDIPAELGAGRETRWLSGLVDGCFAPAHIRVADSTARERDTLSRPVPNTEALWVERTRARVFEHAVCHPSLASHAARTA